MPTDNVEILRACALPDKPKSRSRFASVRVILGALCLIWPALLSGFPLMYPDSSWYLLAGRRVAAAVLLNHRSAYYGNRSLIYSLGILPFSSGPLRLARRAVSESLDVMDSLAGRAMRDAQEAAQLFSQPDDRAQPLDKPELVRIICDAGYLRPGPFSLYLPDRFHAR